MFGLGLAGKCSSLLTAFQLILSLQVTASGACPAPDRSPQVLTVFVVIVAVLQSVLEAGQIAARTDHPEKLGVLQQDLRQLPRT